MKADQDIKEKFVYTGEVEEEIKDRDDETINGQIEIHLFKDGERI